MAKRKRVVLVPIKKVKKQRTGDLVRTEVVTPPASAGVIVSRTSRPPRFLMTRSSVIVHNVEPIFDLNNTLAFTVNRSVIAPFNYPWLGGVAQSFSKWRFLQLRFIYIPSCPTTTAGGGAIGLGYDHTDQAPASIIQVQQTFHSTSFPLWAGYDGAGLLNNHGPFGNLPGAVYVDVDTNRLGGANGPNFYRFVTNATFGPLLGTDRNVYSPGYIDIARSGGLAAPIITGTLFAQYQVELAEPINEALNL